MPLPEGATVLKARQDGQEAGGQNQMVVVIEGPNVIVARSRGVVLVICPRSYPVEKIRALAPLLLEDHEVSEFEAFLDSRGTTS